MTRVVDEPALVLHTRPYRDSSLIVDLLTLHHGRLSAVRPGARGGKSGNALQVFSFLSAGWYGRGQLMTLTTVESVKPHWLTGIGAAAAYYVVELIVRLVREREPVPMIFAAACDAIERLAKGDPASRVLRGFEHRLLNDLGYGLDFTVDAASGDPIGPEKRYRCEPAQGFTEVPASKLARDFESGRVGEDYSGDVLLAIDAGLYSSAEVRRAAKHIFQACLAEHLGPAPLASRGLLPPETGSERSQTRSLRKSSPESEP